MLPLNTVEQARGLVFEYAPESATDITRLGGTLTGSWRYDSVKGQYLNAVAFSSFPASSTGQLFDSGYFSVQIEFVPSFHPSDSNTYYFFASGAGTNARALYKNLTTDLILRSGSNIATVPYATYAPHWLVNQRNTLTVTSRCIGGNSHTMYLNGINLGSYTNAMSIGFITSLFIGASVASTGIFPGYIRSVKFFKHYSASELLTAQEAIDYYNNATFTYQNKAICILPMGAEQHDATNNRTLDVSGKGNHFSLGNGSTASTFPTKLATRGYSMDGGDYFRSAVGLFTPLTDFTLCALTDSTAYANHYLFGVNNLANTGPYFELQYATTVQYRMMGSSTVSFTGLRYLPNTSFIVCCYKGSTSTKWDVYQNGKYILVSAAFPSTYDKNGYLLVGDGYHGNKFTGNYRYFSLYPSVLTYTQAIAEYQYAVSGLNKV